MPIRNFVIIAHIDHGKSTLADRFLELTHTIEKRKMREQMLDTMDLERERGITIKMQPVRMIYRPGREEAGGAENAAGNQEFILNLIDTPGHVDFGYEVSRALAAVEGALLVVDASQGIQAQTIANLHLALREGLAIIPVVNKIDLPNADILEVAEELAGILETDRKNVALVSGKTGQGVKELLDRIARDVPPPEGSPADPLRALIFDSHFDSYKGVIAHVRVVSGSVKRLDRIMMARTKKRSEALEVGIFAPEQVPVTALGAGEIGYIATGLKEAGVRAGDTIMRDSSESLALAPLAGYAEPKPVVFASVYPLNADDFVRLRDALEKLKLNDAALTFEVESSEALGRGFRAGFLGMLHLEIMAERIRREFGLEIVISTPSVAYKILLNSGSEEMAYSAADIPDEAKRKGIAEPWVKLEILAPSDYLGRVLALLESTRAKPVETKYLSAARVLLIFRIPLKEVIVDLYDRLKGVTSGYASLGYEFESYEYGDLERLDVLVAGKRERAFSVAVEKREAHAEGKRIVEKLKGLLPRQSFAVPLQAAIGGQIIARETLRAMTKDVTGYLYGGDRTRKMKLWKKQQKGKKRLAALGMGKVEIPPEVFLKMLKRD